MLAKLFSHNIWFVVQLFDDVIKLNDLQWRWQLV